MQKGFTKLFNTIVTSTIWREDNETRILWITMLAIADRYGEVSGSVPGMAAIANISEDGCRRALQKLESPDPDSRTPDFEGRRIAKTTGGWNILNYELYRKMLNTEERKEYKRIKAAEYRRRGKNVDKSGQTRTGVDSRGQNGAELDLSPPPSTSPTLPEAEAEGTTPLPPSRGSSSIVLSFRWPSWTTKEFQVLFQEWQKIRRAMGKKPKDWHKMFQKQLDWLDQFELAGATESINASIRNNWQGLFEPKPNSNSEPSKIQWKDIT